MASETRRQIKRTLLGAIVICSIPIPSAARGGGGVGGGHIGAAGAVAPATPSRPAGAYPARPVPSIGGGYGYRNWGANQGFGYGAYGLGWGYPGAAYMGWPTDYTGPQEGPSAPTVLIMTPQIQPPEPPPPPAVPVIHEYKWPNTTSGPETTFFIVKNDGQVFRAIAVWTQGNVVSLITPNHTTTTIALDQVDRSLTQSLNEENKLTLWLPPTAEH